ncbi:hypothetical protein FB567DRAFT_628064 [Paraphoma chrysanthemicola]|uniref:Uncharacterized protein n=1 Tax=Paraphoma chrysanthemicola TaxID=798071 RepID=A0A8K0VYV0_9PLEO|nr:hypothetical protein FB567DRAFT_628064 [Paraphoma chrysanthemicola]
MQSSKDSWRTFGRRASNGSISAGEYQNLAWRAVSRPEDPSAQDPVYATRKSATLSDLVSAAGSKTWRAVKLKPARNQPRHSKTSNHVLATAEQVRMMTAAFFPPGCNDANVGLLGSGNIFPLIRRKVFRAGNAREPFSFELNRPATDEPMRQAVPAGPTPDAQQESYFARSVDATTRAEPRPEEQARPTTLSGLPTKRDELVIEQSAKDIEEAFDGREDRAITNQTHYLKRVYKQAIAAARPNLLVAIEELYQSQESQGPDEDDIANERPMSSSSSWLTPEEQRDDERGPAKDAENGASMPGCWIQYVTREEMIEKVPDRVVKR